MEIVIDEFRSGFSLEFGPNTGCKAVFVTSEALVSELTAYFANHETPVLKKLKLSKFEPKTRLVLIPELS